MTQASAASRLGSWRRFAIGLLTVVATLACTAPNPTTETVGEACRAVGRLVVRAPDHEIDVTAVLHFAPPSTLHLRLVDPLGRAPGEIRTDGEAVRVTVRSNSTYWEGRGESAMRDGLGVELSPGEWVDALLGRSTPVGWRLEVGESGGCLPRSLEMFEVGSDRGLEIALSWDAIEAWTEPEVDLGPPPVGYRRVDDMIGLFGGVS